MLQGWHNHPRNSPVKWSWSQCRVSTSVLQTSQGPDLVSEVGRHQSGLLSGRPRMASACLWPSFFE